MNRSDIEVITETPEFLVVSKPHGLRVVEDRYDKSLPTLKGMLSESYGRVWVVHRLDAGTGGVMVVARSAETHRRLNDAFESGQVEKEYVAIVRGRMEAPTECALPISKKIMRGRYRINFTSGRESFTNFFPMAVSDRWSVVRAIPKTGRTHQIRVHLKALGHPLANDPLYGEDSPETKLTLFAESLDIPLGGGERLSWSASMSEYMRKVMQELGFGHILS